MLTDTTVRRLETLGKLSQQGKKINGLFRLMQSDILWWQAYSHIHQNRGAATKGSDQTSLDGISIPRVKKIIQSLSEGNYRFAPVKRVYIPKSNGKTRPLGLPNGNDKLVQEVVKMILEKIYEPNFSRNSHGFRRNHSCHTALSQVRQKWTGMKWIINMDIKGFFDNIDHQTMINILEKRIDDKRFIRLIRQMLEAGYIEDWRFFHTYSGTPQGGIISPILANIYLHELDSFIEGMQAKYNRGKRRQENKRYKQISGAIRRTMHRIDELDPILQRGEVERLKVHIAALRNERSSLSSGDPMDSSYRRLQYVRYADDFLIGVIGEKSEAHIIQEEVTTFLQETLKLDIAADKSGIVHASKKTPFLGYEIHCYTGNRQRKTQRAHRHCTVRSVSERMQLHIPQKKLGVFCKKHRYGNYETYRPLHRNTLIHLSEAEIVKTYNAELRGLANYYALATNAKRDLNKLHGLWQGSMLKTLAAKRRSTVSKVAKSLKHGKEESLIVQTEHRVFSFPIFKLNMMKSAPYETKIDAYPNTWQFTLSSTEVIQRLSANQCEYCKSKAGPFEIHHIKKMASVSKGKQLWQIMMSRRNRKTLVLCVSCHKNLHRGTL
ncbi:reverse transcriptase domain-containing protein [Vibrio parahaemolyticus]|uniref:reverse transcriptase domain-containing protein n=1 Tax=Vibrio parahaemolyticus TaxID=670 RepID=UPI001D168B65|nr:reverse transcriptase domain-containing protein [Vibrio parahaemolyticus]MCC3796910.1 hypothetical protein [Vibrio parahaemolyticus]MCC3811613.1 hypothetical protein [Vibrio parahaemolyticus]MCR9727857.1 reverse transcriptase domain-containing protein [Vibrio parahaemolyticus]MCR9750276.1 reverse transcriptase domain-containing protein [Vibrio parahaemolyticus]MCR9783982.1 reverse transcriptase domain-containing protein [Vibrio parahaemolyticus]